jgi:hypothetical protein
MLTMSKFELHKVFGFEILSNNFLFQVLHRKADYPGYFAFEIQKCLKIYARKMSRSAFLF